MGGIDERLLQVCISRLELEMLNASGDRTIH